MFVPLRRAQTWRLHTKLYKFGWHTSANNRRMKNSRNLILGEVVYIAIIYHIADCWIYLLNGYDFSFDHITSENRELDSWTSVFINRTSVFPLTLVILNWTFNRAACLYKENIKYKFPGKLTDNTLWISVFSYRISVYSNRVKVV